MIRASFALAFFLFFIVGYCGAVTYHVYRDRDGAPFQLLFESFTNIETDTSSVIYADREHTVFWINEKLVIDVVLHDKYILADTFNVYVNGAMTHVCYFDSNDHQNGNLFDIFVAANIYHIYSGMHGACVPITESKADFDSSF